jgi:uncharacterized protein with HEPN domain
MSRDEATLLDMIGASRLIIEFKRDLDRVALYDDEKTQSAILHQLMVLGEAAKRLSASFRSAHPEVPWSLIAGMRDNLIHEYDAVDLDEAWWTAENDIPRLLSQLEELNVALE